MCVRMKRKKERERVCVWFTEGEMEAYQGHGLGIRIAAANLLYVVHEAHVRVRAQEPRVLRGISEIFDIHSFRYR